MRVWIVVPKSGNGKPVEEDVRVFEKRADALACEEELKKKDIDSFTMPGFLCGTGY